LLYLENSMTVRRCLSDLAIFTVEYDFDIHYERKVDKISSYTKEPHQDAAEMSTVRTSEINLGFVSFRFSSVSDVHRFGLVRNLYWFGCGWADY
jgi:hypothetical protein